MDMGTFDSYLEASQFIAATEKRQGFEIYSLSLDQSKSAWLKAIQDDNLDIWKYHVIDLQGWYGKGAQKYGIKQIPYNFLIDKKI